MAIGQAYAITSRRFRASFFFVMALVMTGVIVLGFSQTIDANLIHPKPARPAILYVHAVVFSAWLGIFLLQTGLVASSNVGLHRRLGLAWFFLGAAVPLVGVATAVAMERFRVIHDHEAPQFLSIPLWDMVIFTTFFSLAVRWRRWPEFHRRLMFLATCCLMDAGFARFPVPDSWFTTAWFYGAMDALVLAAMARDQIMQQRIHVAYRVALPVMIAGQITAWSLWQHPPALWSSFCRALVGPIPAP